MKDRKARGAEVINLETLSNTGVMGMKYLRNSQSQVQ